MAMIKTEYGTYSLDLSKEIEPIDFSQYPEADPNEMDKDNWPHWYETPKGKLLND